MSDLPSRLPPNFRSLAALAAGGLVAGAALKALQGRNKISFTGRTVIITGGSRGLGLVMARQLAREGANVALLARNKADLQTAEKELLKRGAKVIAISCDVSRRNEVQAAILQIVKRFGRIDVLINNAGIIQVGPLDHMTIADFEQAMRVHFYGPLYLSLEVLPHMRKAGGGRIVNISSIGGKIAAPHMVPYSASKFALTGLSDGLHAELRSEKILVTTVCPGLMRTGSPPNAQFKGRHREEYAWFAIADSLPLLSMNSERAARKILRACRLGSPHVLLGIHTKSAVLFSDLFPGTKAHLASLMHRLLPKADPGRSTKAYSGWKSESVRAPSLWTRTTYDAARQNNERR